ncbi:MAG: S-layer protein [Candidatus Marsarchaeota archaeon]|nr:S-layer protein [Candidatus Marsarchaeota archaeon]MCL5111253.1 S-layer protein [Candidatus Marsarchaeota archaeon]
MKSINAKRIAAVAAGAALLGVGLAFAGPVAFQNVQIIGSSGQPLVQIVVGSKAAITDGIAAANIAAAIGNLAYTTVGVTATVNASNAQKVLHVTVTNPGAVTLTNQQVWLNQTGTAYAKGSYSFTTLIGSVLNRAVQIGSPSNTKTLQSNSNYAYQATNSITVSPAPSPYWAYGAVPVTTVSKSSGGGISFSSFRSSGYDNILQVTNTQLPALLSNSGSYGETESIWLTAFPVYNQASGTASFQAQSVGGAYQVVFNKPIAVTTGGQGTGPSFVNNAGFSFLGQNWTIIGYTLPGQTSANNTNPSGVTQAGSTNFVAGGQLEVASSLSPLKTVYVGQNLTAGPYTVQLTDIGQPNSNGISPAAINLYKNGALTNVTSIMPPSTASFNISGVKVYVKVNQTFAGLYAYQKYAKIQIYSNVFKLTNGNQYNKTYNQGWNVNLLWTNTSSSSGNAISLYSIVAYNVSPTSLLPGQSFSIMQNPAAWNFEFIGDNLGNNYDPLTFKTSATTSQKFQNGVPQVNAGVNHNINNITEPAQYLTVTSGISNAFSYSGQVSSSVQYDLTPYLLVTNSIAQPANVVTVALSDPAGFISSNNQLTVTVKGSDGNTPETNSSVFSVAGTLDMNTIFTNVTAIQLSGAYPGISVSVNSINGNGANVLANLTTQSPAVTYQLSGKNYLSLASASNVVYNQQNGQPLATFTIGGPTVPASARTSATQYFTYNVIEYPVPGNTAATDQLSFAIFNSTAGPSSNPLFNLNASVGVGAASPGTRNNMTYTPTVGSTGQVNAPLGFRTERGSSVASMSATSVTINYAKAVDNLVFAVSPSTSTPSVSTQRQYGPFAIGQAVNIPGVTNVTVSKVTATATLGANAGYTVTGYQNLTATPSVSSALVPVLLKNLTTTPLVVLDSQANPSSSLILIGSGYVNSLSQQLQASQNITVTPTTQIVQAYGNKILVAGYTAAQTTAAANQFISDLYAAAST